jgi:hypothetical protein
MGATEQLDACAEKMDPVSWVIKLGRVLADWASHDRGWQREVYCRESAATPGISGYP